MRTESSRFFSLWQGLSALLRLAGVLVLMLWLIVAVATAAFHWIIVPRLSDWRPDVERWASAALQTPVHLQGLRASVQDGVPSLEIEGLEVVDAQGHVGLRLQHARAELSVRSLLNLGFDGLRAQGLSVEVRRELSGQWVVGGVALAPTSAAQAPGWLNWVFRQTQWRVVDGSVRWRDAWLAQEQGLSTVPELRLSGVQAVLTNTGRRHLLRLDATPSVAPDQTWTWRADVQSPRLNRASGDWRQWSGTAYWHLAGVDLAVLGQHLDSRALWGVSARSGRGDWRAWVDLAKGRAVGVTNDWAMSDVQVRLGAKLQALALSTLNGRLTWYQAEQGVRLETQNLAFRTRDGLNWPGGNVQWRWQAATGTAPEQSHFTAVDLDLATMSQVATRLPLDTRAHAWLQTLSARGRVDTLQAQWSGPLDQLQRLSVQGKVRGLGLKAGVLPRGAERGDLARPGVQGLDLTFKATENGGTASLAMSTGTWDLPGVWAKPRLALDSLRTQLSWTRSGGRWQVSAKDLRLANADVAASGRVVWTEGQGPGHLDLDLTAERANLAQLARYLPQVIHPDARSYVSAAIQAGQARQVKVRIQGPIADMPYAQAKQGKLLISGDVSGVRMDAAPLGITGGQWPVLRDLSGRYTFDRTRMVLSNVKANWAQLPQLRVSGGQASIDDLLNQPQLALQLEAAGPLQDWLRGVQTTELQTLTRGTLQGVQGRGDGRLSLDLAMPLEGKGASRVQGHFAFSKAAVQWSAQVPLVTQAQGDVQFGPSGVQAKVSSAQALGGPVSLSVKVAAQGDWSAQVSGEASAEALRQRPELAGWGGALHSVQGRAPYSLRLSQRGDAALDWSVESSLQGLAIQAPAPLDKPAAVAWPLRLSYQGASGQSSLSLGPSAAPLISAQWRDQIPGAAGRVRGVVAVGMGLSEVPVQPDQLVAGVRLNAFDVDAWRQWWDQAQTKPSQTPVAAVPKPATTGARSDANAGLGAWLPDRVSLQLGALQAWGWSFHHLALQAQRQVSGGTSVWRAEVSADELQGVVQIEPKSAQASDGRVFARLQRLTLAEKAQSQVETALFEQPRSMPALDVQIDALNLGGRDWGRLDLLASNTMRSQGGRVLHQWRLERLNVTLPEAKLRAQGQWMPEEVGFAPAAQGQWRRTELDLSMDVSDSGALLARFGMPGVVKGGVGKLSGQLGWRGSPVNLDKASLSGHLNLDIGRGQFLQADPGIAKLLGVLSLQSLPRRLLLDFRDVFQEGFGFDSIRGNATIEKGVLRTRDLAMRGPNASVLMEGSADAARETQDLQVVVLPELDAGTLSVWAGLTNPVLGLASYVVQKVFGSALANANTRAFHITGSWQDPNVDPILPEAQEPAPVRTTATPMTAPTRP
jgi:uncharacterized protein (TIGR02099 family)